MANKKNLIPFTSDQSREEAVKNGQKGGIKSGESKRARKLLKDCMLDLLALDVTDRKDWNKLSRMGIDPEDIDNRALLTAALFNRAVRTGDVSAFKEIVSLIGEDHGDDIGKLDEVLDKIEGNI